MVGQMPLWYDRLAMVAHTYCHLLPSVFNLANSFQNGGIYLPPVVG
jgi:hypothetical protein